MSTSTRNHDIIPDGIESSHKAFLAIVKHARKVLEDCGAEPREILAALRRCHVSFEASFAFQGNISVLQKLEAESWTLHTASKSRLLSHCDSIDRKLQPVAWRKAQKLYKEFLDGAQSCYSHALRAVDRAHGALPELRSQIDTHASGKSIAIGYQNGTMAREATEMPHLSDAVRRFVCILLIRLGDLARWRLTTRIDMNTNKPCYRRAIALYELALLAWPCSGHAHNQLGIVGTYGRDTFDAVYQFCRAACAKEPVANARQNLEHQLNLIRSREDPQFANGGGHDGSRDTFLQILASQDSQSFEDALTRFATQMQRRTGQPTTQQDDNPVLQMLVIAIAAYDLDLIKRSQGPDSDTEADDMQGALLLLFDLLSNIAQLCTPGSVAEDHVRHMPSLHIGLHWLLSFLLDFAAGLKMSPRTTELSTLLGSTTITLLGLALERCLNELLKVYDIKSLVLLDRLLPEERDLIGFAPLNDALKKASTTIRGGSSAEDTDRVQAEHHSRVRAIVKLGVRIVFTEALPLSFTGGRFIFLDDEDDEDRASSLDEGRG